MRCVGVLYPRIAPGPSLTKTSWDTDMRCVGVLYPRIAPGPSVTKTSWDTDMRCAGLYIIFMGRVIVTSWATLTLGELKYASPRTVRVSMVIWNIQPRLKCARIFYRGWDGFRVRRDLTGP